MEVLRDQVVVITGASSGLGRAISIELASAGCSVVLAARDGDALHETAARCEEVGGKTLIVEIDVTVPEDHYRLAVTALDEFGTLDVWINNAGVTLYSKLEDGPLHEHEQVIKTNLFGTIYGARAAIPIFRRQHRGTMINVGSVLSHVGEAFVPSYVISKFGVHGVTEALRVELADEPDIHVCTVFPYAIDTPHFETAANEIGKQPAALPPTQSPEKVARAIARLIERPRRTKFVPGSIRLGLLLHALMPRSTERLLLDTLRRWHITGNRGPQISTPRLLAWAAARFAVIQATFAARWLRRQKWLTDTT